MALKDSNTEGSIATYLGFDSADWYAQTFTPSESYDIASVKLLIRKVFTPGTITVSIRATSEGLPTGEDLTSGTTDGSTLPDGLAEEAGEYREITFSAAVSLTSGTKYAIVVRSAALGGEWASEDPGTYTGGDSCESRNSGSTWGVTDGPSDHFFETYSSDEAAVDYNAPRMIPFVYSASVAYSCEFGEEYIRFYYDDAVLLDGASEVWIASPYAEEHLFELQYKQIGDTMWIVHPSYAPRKLTRTSATSFSLDVISYNYGPFLTRNDLVNPDAISSASMSFSGGTLTCTGEIFTSDHIGAIFKLVHPRSVTTVSLQGSGYSDSISGEGTYSLITRGTWTGEMRIQRNENNAGWDTFRTYKSSSGAEQNISVSFDEESTNVQFRLYGVDTSASFRGELSTDNYLQEGIVKITAVTDSQTATAYPIIPVSSTGATKRWAEGAWSDARTYPSSITFFDDRCVLAGQRVIQDQVLIYVEPPE